MNATELGDLKTAAWSALRRAGQTATPVDFDAATLAARQVEAACEEYRRANVPNAAEVFVICDYETGQPLEVYARTGRRVVLIEAVTPFE